MKRTILATYVRESTLPHYCKSAWVYASHLTKIECCFDDCSEERKDQSGDENCRMITYRYNPKTGKKEEISINELFPDLYTIITTNAKGVQKEHSFRTKEEANAEFANIKSHFKGWRKL